ncbi:DUF1774-domain-containing protein [Bimuria novae-zelandiae CBS 107.79]|uniref:DUF1774-domain-containing protein n=1 Tax=Bimuria novae-zelandiae CBS 107.79 TaxID=1447943 RepID=A0A6A5VRW8_9PLEO|nr:DUF1774-domain-containing protein [Bimuria novae-zelandiae CBS 107.79]
MAENGAASSGSRVNPFSRREEFSSRELILHRITTIVTYIIFVITAIYYTFERPHEGHQPRHTIWGQNLATPFKQNSVMTSIYWIFVLLLQLVYAYSLYSRDTVYVNAAANIGTHYIASNLLLFGFIHLWVRSHLWLAELLIVVNFFNLTFAYFRHSTTPRPIHIGTVAGPLAWNFVALYWVGARAVNKDTLPARIVGNIFIWGILAYGAFFLVAFKDYTMGFALSYLAFSTGVGQFLTKLPVFQLQWIFAFTIGALLFILSLGVSSGKAPLRGGEVVSEDRERAPLLHDGPDVPQE